MTVPWPRYKSAVAYLGRIGLLLIYVICIFREDISLIYIRSAWVIDHVAGWEPDDLTDLLQDAFPSSDLYKLHRTLAYIP